MPESSLICIQRHVKETACGFFHVIGTARQIRQEQYAIRACRDIFGCIVQYIKIITVFFLPADRVLEPAQRQAARTDIAPVEIGIRQCTAVENQSGPLLTEFRNNALCGNAEHRTGACHIHSLSCSHIAAAKHGLHRITGAAANRCSCCQSRLLCHFFCQMSDNIPWFDNLRHHGCLNTKKLQLLR